MIFICDCGMIKVCVFNYSMSEERVEQYLLIQGAMILLLAAVGVGGGGGGFPVSG